MSNEELEVEIRHYLLFFSRNLEFDKRIGSFLLPIIHPQDREFLSALPDGLSAHEFRVQDAHGQMKWVYGNFDCSKDSQTVLCAFFDISEQKKLLMSAEQEALIDPLTGVKTDWR